MYSGIFGCQPLSAGPLPLSGKGAYKGTANISIGPDGHIYGSGTPIPTIDNETDVNAGKIPSIVLAGIQEGECYGAVSGNCRSPVKGIFL